ncbi:MAG: primosomal protein N' [Burkholderiaceae bacterium]|jgi:primosomal protein N' (replication factor Y)
MTVNRIHPAPCENNNEGSIVGIAIDIPRPGLFSYRWFLADEPCLGSRVLVPWGTKRRVGVVWQIDPPSNDIAPENLKSVIAVLDPNGLLDTAWRRLLQFAADYYHYPIGAAIHDALPKSLKALGARSEGLQSTRRALERWRSAQGITDVAADKQKNDALAIQIPVLNAGQQAVTAAMSARASFQVHLLYGITGSGKTEIYLQRVIEAVREKRQALLLLPEINLTPQTEQLFRQRLAGLNVVTLHSGMADGPRLKNWWQAMQGEADVVVGTRLAVFVPLPRLGLVIVDEEHDPSYKQSEGLKYSARDLAVARGQQTGCPVILGSATPSLESWLKAEQGHYHLHRLAQRAVQGAVLPTVQLVDIRHHLMVEGLAKPVMAALKAVFEKKQQSLVFLNRRGYAPVLSCGACGWVAGCQQCSSHMVWHRQDRRLQCHHCGAAEPVPRHCPACGNQDLTPFGRGTQRIEETLQAFLPTARLLRIDADSTRRKGSAQAAFDQAHAGGADILVGTQMVAKGHDFRNVALVVALNVDAALFSSQTRAPERLFAQLMQVAGRAGRHGQDGQVLVQTRYPHHPLFAALQHHDYPTFAADELTQRRDAHAPPYVYQALLRADHGSLAKAIDFLQRAKATGLTLRATDDDLWLCDPVPLTVVKVAGVERAQLLIESISRPRLHRFLTDWLAELWAMKGPVRWYLEVDPYDL